MKHTNTMLLAFTATAIFFSSAAFCAPQSTVAASTPPAKAAAAAKTESAESTKAASNIGATPHNHMRDSKGIYVAPKKPAKPVSKPDAKTEPAKASAPEK